MTCPLRSSIAPPLETVTPTAVPPARTTSVPPDLTTVALAVAPESTSKVPPPLTSAPLSMVPLVSSITPLRTFQVPPVPLTVQAPPITLKVVNPKYCVPMEFRSNVSEPVPPSCKVLLPDASTMPPIM
jgi:hypothetical protein